MGAAGDMLTAALLELHDAPEAALTALNQAFTGIAVLSMKQEKKCGIIGTHLTVSMKGLVEGEERQKYPRHGHHASLAEVREFISGLELPRKAIRDALASIQIKSARLSAGKHSFS